MPSLNPLQQLRDLKRSSAEFPDQLIDVLLGEDWMDQTQHLPHDDVKELVGYLDGVRVRIAFTCSLLIRIVGPQRLQPQQSCLLPLFV